MVESNWKSLKPEKGNKYTQDYTRDYTRDYVKDYANDPQELPIEDLKKISLAVRKVIILMSCGFSLVLLLVTIILALVLNETPGTTSANQETALAAKDQAIFYSINPAFVVNFQNSVKSGYLQVNVDVMARSKKVIEHVVEHLPLIKNDLITLFSSQDYEILKEKAGKDNLRVAALKVIQDVLQQETGDKGIEEVLFTSFVMQ